VIKAVLRGVDHDRMRRRYRRGRTRSQRASRQQGEGHYCDQREAHRPSTSPKGGASVDAGLGARTPSANTSAAAPQAGTSPRTPAGASGAPLPRTPARVHRFAANVRDVPPSAGFQVWCLEPSDVAPSPTACASMPLRGTFAFDGSASRPVRILHRRCCGEVRCEGFSDPSRSPGSPLRGEREMMFTVDPLVATAGPGQEGTDHRSLCKGRIEALRVHTRDVLVILRPAAPKFWAAAWRV
jgi:hypothetical protein